MRSLAEEPPLLRLQKANEERYRKRLRTKLDAIARAKAAVKDTQDKQRQVADLFGNAALAVGDLCTLLNSVVNDRDQAADALAVADRIDYEIELEGIEAQGSSSGRGSEGIDHVLAARHGEPVIKAMLEDLDPGFSLLRGCKLNDQLLWDMAEFVIKQAVSGFVLTSTSAVEG